MNAAILIPARYASSRLHAKPLADIEGKTLIQRVYEQATKSHLAGLVAIATDSLEIFDHLDALGAHVIMTSDSHQSGTDRIAEASRHIDADIIINIQGDEPLIQPEQIDDLIRTFNNPEIHIATQRFKIERESDIFDFNVVKVVCDKNDKALYFSRQAIPACRDFPYREWMNQATYFRHIGIYGYRKSVLHDITSLPKSGLESVEFLEQLRWLENGYNIYCPETEYQSIGVDTAEDLEKVRAIIRFIEK